MKAVQQHIEAINEYQKTADRSKNPHIINDYSKAIRRLKRELKTYCKFRGYDYNNIMKRGC